MFICECVASACPIGTKKHRSFNKWTLLTLSLHKSSLIGPFPRNDTTLNCDPPRPKRNELSKLHSDYKQQSFRLLLFMASRTNLFSYHTHSNERNKTKRSSFPVIESQGLANKIQLLFRKYFALSFSRTPE